MGRKGRWGRIAAVTACLCLATASAATAGPMRRAGAKAPVQLTMWWWGDQEAAGLKGFVADSVKKYEAANPNIKISVTLQSTDNLVPAFRAAAAKAGAELSTASTDSHDDAMCSANPPVEVKQSSALPRA